MKIEKVSQHTISWMFWSNSGGPSSNWSKEHFLLNSNDRKTICNLRIPDAFKYSRNDYDIYCSKCFKKFQKLLEKDKSLKFVEIKYNTLED